MFKTHLNMMWRLFFIRNSRNDRTIDGLGFFHVLSPLFRDIAENEDELAEMAGRHLGYFNANPILASYIVGVVMNLELKKKAGEDISADRIDRVKQTLSAVLTAKGDYFFEVILIPLALTIGSIFAIYSSYIGSSYIGPIIFLVSYNLYHLHSRIGGYRTGLLLGEDVGRELAGNLFREQKFLGGFAVFVSGCFAALIFFRGWSLGGYRFVIWGVLALVGVFLLGRKISLIWVVLVLFLASAIFLVVFNGGL
ncbi:MAG: PTS system mannose/fructose/sorbose family transporter subunit IID [Candidatus Krumholzibacteria bacterium]|nr:PTS system mannose/fructose/sorbose family transporter subunit IID [Candidatus Krumholzibacteria bacterium]